MDRLPGYAPLLASRHAAHRRELRKIIVDLPLETARLIIDAPCGDGFYSARFAEALAADGRIVAADISFEYLQAAQKRICGDATRSRILIVRANSYALPFRGNQFDLAWCAQSLLTLKQPVMALEELRRVVRPGAYVVILEEDRVNEMSLPWPEDLELAIREAEQRALDELMKQHSAESNPARHMPQLLERAGLAPYRRSTYTIRRRFPLAEQDQTFLQHYFAALRKRVSPYLARDQTAKLDFLTDPGSHAYLPHQPGFRMSWQEIVSVGVKR